MFLASVVCGFTAVSVPNWAGAIVFLIAMLAGFAKLARLFLIVAALVRRLINARSRPSRRHLLLDRRFRVDGNSPPVACARSTQVTSWPRTGKQVGAVSFPLVGRPVIIPQM